MSRVTNRQGTGGKAVMKKIAAEKNKRKRARKAAKTAQLGKMGA